jgi:hypothetical protein
MIEYLRKLIDDSRYYPLKEFIEKMNFGKVFKNISTN